MPKQICNRASNTDTGFPVSQHFRREDLELWKQISELLKLEAAKSISDPIFLDGIPFGMNLHIIENSSEDD